MPLQTLLPELSLDENAAEMRGVVFDIQRCSMQDGPGIRTTVFLKGCPLHCKWCHNPESISPKPQLAFDESRCVGCLHCLDVCPTGAHIRNSGGGHVFDFDRCTACGKCVDVCAGEAVRMIGQMQTVDDVMDVVLRDRPYYIKSGGGLTVSGGEPMAQYEFTLELLKRAKAEGIHTCVETSGAASWRKFKDALPWVDLFLFDYKATQPDVHRDLIGCNNGPLLRNLADLLSAGANVILRCPLVPGVNDSDRHLKGIAGIAASHTQLLGVEIMPYHNFGVAKGERVGMENSLPGVNPPNKETQDRWIDRLHTLGCSSARVS